MITRLTPENMTTIAETIIHTILNNKSEEYTKELKPYVFLVLGNTIGLIGLKIFMLIAGL